MYKLLIVDDEMWSRRLIREVLDWQALGFLKIYEAENGHEALNHLKKHKCELMIMDMRMPGMDGMALLQELGIHTKTKIIVMSGYDDFEYLRQALLGNAIDYLLKPINKKELEKAVKKAIANIQLDDVESQLIKMATDLENNRSFIKYLNLKNELYANIISQHEAKMIHVFEMISAQLEQAASKAFTHYVFLDLKFMTSELKEAHLAQTQHKAFDKLGSIDTIKDIEIHLKELMTLMKNPDTKGKLYIESVLAYVDTHFAKHMTLESLSQIFHISKEHLSRAFKKETNQTVTAYVNEKRISYAKQLMLTKKLSIKTAAAMAGFTHLHYFYKMFKKSTNQTPSQYLKQHNINIV